MLKEMNAEQAKSLYDNGTPFIDVREDDEFEQIRIPGSKLMPMSQMNALWKEIPKDDEVVIYCRSGHRSGSLISQLFQMGYENLINLEGGIISWYDENYPTESGPVVEGNE